VKTWTSAANSTVFDTGHCGNAGELKKVLFHTVPTFQAQVQCCPRMVSVWPDSSMLHCGERAARCPLKAKGTVQRLKAPISARHPFSAAQLSTVRAAPKAEISKTSMDDAAILAALPSWTIAQSAGFRTLPCQELKNRQANCRIVVVGAVARCAKHLCMFFSSNAAIPTPVPSGAEICVQHLPTVEAFCTWGVG